MEIKIGSNKSEDQQNTSKISLVVFNWWEKIIHLFRDYFLLLSGAKYKTIYREGLKILTPK